MASIAGNVHSAKPAATDTQTKRYYPQLEGIDGIHPEVAKAVRTLYDNVYQLRDSHQNAAEAAKGGAAASDKTPASSTASDPAYATGIHGIQVRAPTDPSSLKEGMTLRYDAKQGQFVFGV
jgi:hypothetical protein